MPKPLTFLSFLISSQILLQIQGQIAPDESPPQLNLRNFPQTLISTPNEPSESSEFFISVEDEIDLGSMTTLASDGVLDSLVTKYPILIPNSEETITESEYSVLPSYDEEYQATDGSIRSTKRGRIDSSAYFKRSCGIKEKCPEPKGLPIVNASVDRVSRRPEEINYMKEPFYCRCDRGICDEYGDCCATIATTLLYDNPWKCHKVQQDNLWALMISKCPEPSDPSRIPCEDPEFLPERQYSYLHDIPVYNNITRKLYRNIYCAKCNNIPQAEIYPLKIKIRCSRNLTIDPQSFISGARYQPGKRIWTTNGGNTTCGIFSPELDGKRIQSVIPEIRFCRQKAVDFCPIGFEKENLLVSSLCSSYTQYVNSRYGPIFKNPHCAECHGMGNNWDLKCLHDQGPPSPFGKLSPGQAGASLGSTGLGLLFDFDLGHSESFVGYETKCTGDTIWDFLRQKCTPTLCAKDHIYDPSDGACHLLPPSPPPSSTPSPYPLFPSPSPGPQNFSNPSPTPTPLSLNSSSCYILILQPHEYILLPNSSILVNQTSSTSSTLIFHPGEYSSYNESDSSLSICAQDLASNFSSRFSPVLNYISLTALGTSVFFSLLHLLVFFLLPKMRNLPGKNLFCLTSSLFISQLVFLTLITSSTRVICILASISMHYFFLSSFFWMNVMSFDIWRTFSSEFRMSRNSSRTFLNYSLYAWITPGLIVGSSTLLDFILGDLPSFQGEFFRRIRPLYGHNNLCWISQGLSLFTFFALPAAILICLNLILFTLTAKAILNQSRDTRNFFKGQQQHQGQKATVAGSKTPSNGSSQRSVGSGDAEVDRMKLYGKLGIIMGLTWILGFLSGMSGWEWLWYPFVIFNGLQGAFIFFAFDVKPKVWEMLKERLHWDVRVLGGFKSVSGGGGILSRRDTGTSTSSSTLRTTTANFRHGSVPMQVGAV